jgi:hypothetical protein
LKVPRAELAQELAPPAATFYEMLQAERGMYDTYLDYFACIDKKMPCENAAECFTEHMEGTCLSARDGAATSSCWISQNRGARRLAPPERGAQQHKTEPKD